MVVGLAVLLVLAVAVPVTLLQVSKQQQGRSNASASPVSLSLVSSQLTQPVGSEFDVAVTLNTGANNVSGIDTKITYDPTLLRLTSFTPAATFTSITNDTTGSGTVNFVGVNLGTTVVTGSDIAVGTLKFLAIAPGSAVVGFGNIQLTGIGESSYLTVDTNATTNKTFTLTASDVTIPPATPTPTASQTTITPTPGNTGDSKLNLNIVLPGIGSNSLQENSTPSATTRPFTYTVGGSTAQSGTLTYLPESGNFTGTITAAPNSNVKIKLPNTLTKLLQTTNGTSIGDGIFKLSPTTLVSGDVVPDNIIDVSDYNALLTCFNKTCTIAQLQQADLNDDGIVDAKDLNILLRAFSTHIGD